MADTKIKPSTRVPGASAVEQYVAARGLVDGTIFTAEWLTRMALEGRMYTVNIGLGTAPIAGAGAYVNTTPDVDMSVPSGMMIIPVFAKVVFETYGTSLLVEVVGAVGKGGVIAPTSATAQTPVNHRLDIGNDSGVTVVSDGTGATYMTPAGSVLEFWRDGEQFGISKTSASATVSSTDQTRFEWSALKSGLWPIMYATDGITRLNLFFCAQAPTYFASLTFVKPPLAA